MTSAAEHRRRLGLGLALGAVIAAAAAGAIVTADSGQTTAITIADDTDTAAAAPVAEAAAQPVGLALPDLEGDLGQNEVEPTVPIEPERADGGCTIGAQSVRLSSEGDGVACLQQALADEGYYDGAIDGDFDDPTLAAVMAYQGDQGLFVDGVVGRESALELDIWPDEDLLVVRTPPPPPNTPDSTGYLLSPVASVGADAPPLPENSGDGSTGRLRPCGPTGVGRRRQRADRPVVARLGQQVQQRMHRHAHGVQPFGDVDGLERPGVAADT